MTTLLVSQANFTDHRTPEGHVERADRIRAVEEALARPRFDALLRREAPMGDLMLAELVHERAYLDILRQARPAEGIGQIDRNTYISSGSLGAVSTGLGGALAALDAVILGEADNAFCAIRPPGHHAERAAPGGFCLINTIAITAREAQRKYGAERIAIVDFDVHHGNGTQDIFAAAPDVFYVSSHQMPLYPGTGAVSERGEHDNIVNAPLRPGDGGEQFREAMETRILPRLVAFGPELVIVSAGFDAHRRDPLANLQLEEEDFGWATRRIMEVADKTARGRLVSVLEGGYDLEGLSKSAAAHVVALMRG